MKSLIATMLTLTVLAGGVLAGGCTKKMMMQLDQPGTHSYAVNR